MKIFAVACLFLAAAPLPAAEFVEGHVIVKLTVDAAARAQTLPESSLPTGLLELDQARGPLGISSGFRVIRKRGAPIGDPALFQEIGLDRLYVLRSPRADATGIDDLVDKLSRLPWVEYAEPDYIGELTATTPNDPRFPDQWAHNNTGQSGGTIDADMDSVEAWDLGTGSAAGVVAILDTGVDLDHPDLVANLLTGYDIHDDDPDPNDIHGHGTGTAGIAAAAGNNGISVAGVCWNCAILPVKVCSDGGQCPSVSVADGIVYAADNGADAISLSLATRWSQALSDATDYALGIGALCFAASGNVGGYYGWAPAAQDSCVSVGGSDDDDERLYNYGDHHELTGPSNVVTTWNDGGEFESFDGTSAAVPHASGLAAMLRATDPGLHVNELRHLMRLGADDGVGLPAEDTFGWDPYMGYGRINSNASMLLIDGPWLALDRPHYVCGGDLTVALKDETGGATATATLNVGGDQETVILTPVTADGYYEGTISLSWAGVDGPAAVGDGKLDVSPGSWISATRGALSAGASVDCFKDVCLAAVSSKPIAGDCDGDRAADPGEVWQFDVIVRNQQTEPFDDVTVTLQSTSPDVIVLDGSDTLQSLHPVDRWVPSEQVTGMIGTLTFQVLSTAAPMSVAPLTLSIAGEGWISDDVDCSTYGLHSSLAIPVNRDVGSPITGWDFDDGTSMGWQHAVAHGSGDLSECDTATWGDDWEDLPVTDRAHSGSYSMRVGDGASYAFNVDAALTSPQVQLPAGGAVLGFRLWMDTDIAVPPQAWDGLAVEAKDRFSTIWDHQRSATYNSTVLENFCLTSLAFPFGHLNRAWMFAGDGGQNAALGGDTFDYEHLVDVSDFAGLRTQFRFRFGSDATGLDGGEGAWVDSVMVYNGFTADTWAGSPPTNATGSDTNCPASFDLSWDAVSGASGYAVYRSEVSCEDAQQATTALGTPAATTFSDTTAQSNVPYFYAIEGREPGTSCPTVRACVAGMCACTLAGDTTGLLASRSGGDVLLSWNDPAMPGIGWNVYRDTAADTMAWGAPHAVGVADADPGTPGIQFVDVGGANTGGTSFYLITTVNACGETPLR